MDQLDTANKVCGGCCAISLNTVDTESSVSPNDVECALFVKLVSHWHANFSRLFCEFCRGLSHDIRASVARMSLEFSCVANSSRTGREGFKHV